MSTVAQGFLQYADRVLGPLTTGIFVGSMHIVTTMLALATWRYWAHGPTDTGFLLVTALIAVLTFTPLKWTTGKASQAFISWVCGQAGRYFPVVVKLEDEESLKAGKPYIMAFEPHSSLPVGIPCVFAPDSPLLPKFLRGNFHAMASSVCFVVPIIRQLWWWLGLRPVSRHLISRLLKRGKSVMLCPGGVQEVLYMDHTGKNEVVFLKKRHGFVKMALQHGVPLVPVFAFGQTRTFSWFRPKPEALVHWISRQVGAVPLLLWGRYGTPLPHPVPVTIVVGKPIEVPHLPNPSHEEIDKWLQVFIREMQALFERNHKTCGAGDVQLRVM